MSTRTTPPEGRRRQPPQTLAQARAFVVGDTIWTVREFDASRLPRSRGPLALLFEGERGWRIVWAYPSDWHRLSDAELAALSLTR